MMAREGCMINCKHDVWYHRPGWFAERIRDHEPPRSERLRRLGWRPEPKRRVRTWLIRW
jgi:hypothetical protein